MNFLKNLFHREPKAAKTELWNDIIGYRDIKEVLSLSLKSTEPVHIGFIGPPASAKTLFLLDIYNKHREQAYFVDATDTTKVGLRDVLFTQRPKFLIIDELDKLQKKDQAILLNVMETGILSTTVHKKINQTQLKLWVFATINDSSKVMGPLKSRLQLLNLPEYTQAEFMEIGIKLLGEKGIGPETAKIITSIVFEESTRDIREVLRLGKIIMAIDTETVDKAQVTRIIRTVLKYGGPKDD